MQIFKQFELWAHARSRKVVPSTSFQIQIELNQRVKQKFGINCLFNFSRNTD